MLAPSLRTGSRHMRLAALTLLLLAESLVAQAERPTQRVGDSTIVPIIRAELQALYPTFRPAVGVLTTANPLEQAAAVGTEILGFEEAGRLSRIVASASTPRRKYAVEYYGAPGEPPRFVFESAIYPDDAPDRPAGRNFWGQPSWERRLYLQEGQVVFTETIGDRAGAAESSEVHARRFARLREMLAAARAARR